LISFAEADRLYVSRQHRALAYHRARHADFERFCQATGHILHAIGEAAMDDEWLRLVRTLRRYRFDHLAAPLAFSDPASMPHFGVDHLRQSVALATVAHPHLTEQLRTTMDLLLTLWERDDNPLLDRVEILTASRGGMSMALVLAESRLVEPVKEVLARQAWANDLDVVTPAMLRGPRCHDHLVVLGPARWFPDYVFAAPRADDIDMITFAWMAGTWRSSPAFLATDTDLASSSRDEWDEGGPTIRERDSDDIIPDLDRDLVEYGRSSTRVEDIEDIDMIEARLYSLDGGEAVFLDATGGETTLIIDPRAEERSRVRQGAERDIVPGMYVVLRTNDVGDHVVEVADRILGDRRDAYRTAQARWKEGLRARVREHKLEDTCLELLCLGAARAEETNVRHWMSPRNIGTRERSDFAGIMTLIGMADETERYWKITRALRSAHLRAGVIIRKKLVALVRDADPAEFERQGRLSFALPESNGGRLTAYRVEGRSAGTIRVPASRIERAFRRED